MLAAVKKAGVIHMVCHNYRRAPAVMLAKRLIEEGKLGTLYHYRGTYLQDWIVDPTFPLVWRLRKESAGSGALGDIASHSLDLARFRQPDVREQHALFPADGMLTSTPNDPSSRGITRYVASAWGCILGISPVVRSSPAPNSPYRAGASSRG